MCIKVVHAMCLNDTYTYWHICIVLVSGVFIVQYMSDVRAAIAILLHGKCSAGLNENEMM